MSLDRTPCHVTGKCDLAYQKTNGQVITVGMTGLIKVFDITTECLIQEFDKKQDIHTVAMDQANDSNILLGYLDSIKTVSLNRVEEEKEVLAISSETKRLAMSPDSKWIAFASKEQEISLVDVTTLTRLPLSPGHQDECLNLAFSPDSRWICSTSKDGFMHIYDLATKSLVKQQKIAKASNHEFQTLSPCWSPDSKTLFLPGANILYLQELQEDLSFVFKSENAISHDDEITTVLALDQGLITTGLDSSIKIWSYGPALETTLLKKFQLESCVQSLIYQDDTLCLLDQESYIAFQKYEFPKELPLKKPIKQEPLAMEEEIQAQPSQMVPIVQRSMQEESVYEETLADKLINLDPHQTIKGSSTSPFLSRRFINQNLMGSIILREEAAISFIDIEFAEKQSHKTVIIPNTRNLRIGDMNHAGAILASGSSEEDHENEQESVLFFKHFAPLFQENSWELTLNSPVRCLAIGEKIYVACEDQSIKVFGTSGVEELGWSEDRPVLGMAAYENHLAVVVQSSIPWSGFQPLELRLYISGFRVSTLSLPIQSYSSLRWLGFSQEGLLALQDDKGFIRILLNEKWITIHEDKQFWMVGIWDYEIFGISLGKLELEPTVIPKPHIQTISLASDENMYWVQKLNLYHQNNIKIEHETYRMQQWSIFKQIRDKVDPFFKISENIMDQTQIQALKFENEKLSVDLFREFLIRNDFERAISFAKSFINNIKMLQMCINLCKKLGFEKIVPKLNFILQEKQLLKQIKNDTTQDTLDMPLKQAQKRNTPQSFDFAGKQTFVQQIETAQNQFNINIQEINQQNENTNQNETNQVFTKTEVEEEKNVFQDLVKFGLGGKKTHIRDKTNTNKRTKV